MKKSANFARLAAVFAIGTLFGTASAAIMYDANVTPDVIFGSGNANGSFTVDRSNDIELGLRGKRRHNAAGSPENTFNSNGDGTYSFVTGQAFGQSAPTGVWSVEFSINSSFSGGGSDLTNPLVTYIFEGDMDPSGGTSFNSVNALTFWLDNAYGNNSTANGSGTPKAAPASGDFVAQNSQKGVWLIPGYDPNLDATYDFRLTAVQDFGTANEVVLASTQIQIIAGEGGARVPGASVPDGGSMFTMLGASLFGLAGIRRFLTRKGA